MSRSLDQHVAAQSHPRRRCGFTLVELLAATAAAAVLMAGVLTVIAMLGRDQARMRARDSNGGALSAQQRLIELIGRDLSNGRDVSIAGDPGMTSTAPARLMIDGYGAIDETSLLPDGRAARVTYELVADGIGTRIGTEVRMSLVRRQRLLDDPRRAGKSWSQVVASGLAKFSIMDDSPKDKDARRARGVASGAAAAKDRPLHTRLRVTIESAGKERPTFDHVFICP